MMDLDRLSHPEELLEAYALGVLEEAEALEVESHLDACYRCRQSAGRLQMVAASLAGAVQGRRPPATLRRRLMDALPRSAPAAEYRLEAPPPPHRPFAFRLRRVLAPLAAVLVAGLIAANLVATSQLYLQVKDMEEQNASLTRLEKLSDAEAQDIHSLDELRTFASYWLADSPNMPLVLQPPESRGSSEGILLVDEDGRRAMLMVAGMRELPEPSSYQVMLSKQDGQQPVWVGQLKVDSTGRGNVALYMPDEPIFAYDKVMLTADAVAGLGKGGMALEGQIIAKNLAR